MERVVRRVVREELAAQSMRPAGELAIMATFARDHAISVSTVRAMIRDGRLSAVKRGSRWWHWSCARPREAVRCRRRP